MQTKEELLFEIEQRHKTRELGYLDANGNRVSQIGTVGEALYEALQEASRATESPVETTEWFEW